MTEQSRPEPPPPPEQPASPPPAAPQSPPGYSQPAPPQQPASYQAAPAAKTNGFSIASLVLGILWLYWVGSLLALVFGYLGKKQIDDSAGTQRGRGLAIAGIVLGWVGVGTFVLVLLLGGSLAIFGG